MKDGAPHKVYVLVMVLGYSRAIYAEFFNHCDIHSFLVLIALSIHNMILGDSEFFRIKLATIRVAGECCSRHTTTSVCRNSLSWRIIPAMFNNNNSVLQLLR